MTPRHFAYLLVFLMIFLSLVRCNSSKSDTTMLTADSASIALGQSLFNQNCTACHDIVHDGIGPGLGGITEEVSDAWLKNFIKSPKAIIESGDERASRLFEKFKSVMPSFTHYSDEQIQGLIAFLHTKKGAARRKIEYDPDAVKNPIPERIPMSDLVVALKPVTQIPFSADEYPRTRICKLDHQPGTNTLFVVDLRGKLYYLQNDTPKVYLDMVRERPNFIHKPGLATGFGSFAFHPEFQKNGLLYTSHVESPGSGTSDFVYNDSIPVMLQWVVTEWKTNNPKTFPFSGAGREVMRVNMVHSFHGMQEITFNPMAKKGDEDYSLLYIGIGDGAAVERGYPFLAGRQDRIWGSIIRIDPAGRNSKNGKYGIPKSNPFVNSKDPATVKEIYAYGFRNPHRISWATSEQILASNIGHHNIEGLNIILPGHYYGWPEREGTFVINPPKRMSHIYALPADDSIKQITYPVAQYDHDEGNAISGGFEYTGKAIPELKGKYLFGDIVRGRLFYVEVDDLKIGSQAQIMEWQVSLKGMKKTLVELSGADKVDMRFGKDHDGEMYILTKPDGMVYRLESSTVNY